MSELYPGGLVAGQIFSYWTVIGFAERRSYVDYYTCRCECGKVKEVRARELIRGKSKSCGNNCSKKVSVTAHPFYRCWEGMISRCYNRANNSFANYGGRGITVCKEWHDDFYQFAADMGSRPNGCTIDRRDNDGNYCPENCRWADRVTQCNNTRRNRLFTIDGETKTLADWARFSNIRPHTVNCRINKYKWTIEKALSEPVRANQGAGANGGEGGG